MSVNISKPIDFTNKTDKSVSVGSATGTPASDFATMLSKHMVLAKSDNKNIHLSGIDQLLQNTKDHKLSDESIDLLAELDEDFSYKAQKNQPKALKINTESGNALEKRLSKYAHLIELKAHKYNLDPTLLASLIKQESNFNPYAVSHCGAMGLGQLMPATARELGVSDPFNASQNIEGCAKYLSQQLNTFNGNVGLALAAYNAGPGAVKKHGGIPPFAETQNYVKAVQSHYKTIANLTSENHKV